MSSTTLRGSKWAELVGIQETLKLVLNVSVDEKQLRESIQGVINNMQKRIDKLEPNAGKR